MESSGKPEVISTFKFKLPKINPYRKKTKDHPAYIDYKDVTKLAKANDVAVKIQRALLKDGFKYVKEEGQFSVWEKYAE